VPPLPCLRPYHVNVVEIRPKSCDLHTTSLAFQTVFNSSLQKVSVTWVLEDEVGNQRSAIIPFRSGLGERRGPPSGMFHEHRLGRVAEKQISSPAPVPGMDQ
jgi:hypothetical protein